MAAFSVSLFLSMSDSLESCGSGYDINQPYEWNYENVPTFRRTDVSPLPGRWTYCGLPVSSPLAMAAGPLLNGRWILEYAKLGFDVLTYKTVRGRARGCYPVPNLVPVSDDAIGRCGGNLKGLTPDQETKSWAISFGMPSRDPEDWMGDVRLTRDQLAGEQRLAVSVVASPDRDSSLESIVHDYVDCATKAVEAGADVVEANFSCPNVDTPDGQIYLDAWAAGAIAQAMSNALGAIPLAVKVGFIESVEKQAELVDAIAPYATAAVMVNGIGAKLTRGDEVLFEGATRGIGGMAIREASLRQCEQFVERIERVGASMRVIGVGGIGSADDVSRYVNAGCEAVQLATAAMKTPDIGLSIRAALASSSDAS